MSDDIYVLGGWSWGNMRLGQRKQDSRQGEPVWSLFQLSHERGSRGHDKGKQRGCLWGQINRSSHYFLDVVEWQQVAVMGNERQWRGRLVRADDGEDVREKKTKGGSATFWSFTGTAGVWIWGEHEWKIGKSCKFGEKDEKTQMSCK